MSNTYVNGVPFQHRQGFVLLPQRDTAVFASPLVNHVGGQTSGKRSPAFTLMLTKYTESNLRQLTERFIEDLNGRRVTLKIDGLNYLLPSNGMYKFFCSYARVVWTGEVAHASGYHDGTRFDYSPAAKVVAQTVFYAVPA